MALKGTGSPSRTAGFENTCRLFRAIGMAVIPAQDAPFRTVGVLACHTLGADVAVDGFCIRSEASATGGSRVLLDPLSLLFGLGIVE